MSNHAGRMNREIGYDSRGFESFSNRFSSKTEWPWCTVETGHPPM